MTDGCVHLQYNSSLKFHQFAVMGSSCQGNWYGMENAGGAARPSRTKSHIPGHSLPAVFGQHSSLRPHWLKMHVLCPPAESLQACAKTCVYFACSTNLQIPAYSRTQVSDHDFQIRFEFYNHACIAMQ
jgi:hypothetical protein